MNLRQIQSNINLATKKIGQKTLKHFAKNFNKQGSEKENGAFVRWADRKNQKNNKPLLVKTGRLKESFQIKYNKNGSFRIFNNVPYATYHQNGKGNLPQREMLYESKELDKIVEKEMDKAVEDALDKLFL